MQNCFSVSEFTLDPLPRIKKGLFSPAGRLLLSEAISNTDNPSDSDNARTDSISLCARPFQKISRTFLKIREFLRDLRNCNAILLLNRGPGGVGFRIDLPPIRIASIPHSTLGDRGGDTASGRPFMELAHGHFCFSVGTWFGQAGGTDKLANTVSRWWRGSFPGPFYAPDRVSDFPSCRSKFGRGRATVSRGTGRKALTKIRGLV